MRINHTERALSLLSDRDHHCNMKNIYLQLAGCFLTFLGCFMGVFRLFHGCFKDTSKLFQQYFNVILEYIMSVLRVLFGCFYPIEFTVVAALVSVHKINLFGGAASLHIGLPARESVPVACPYVCSNQLLERFRCKY